MDVGDWGGDGISCVGVVLFALLVNRLEHILARTEADMLAPLHNMSAVAGLNTLQQGLVVVVLIVVDLGHDIVARLVNSHRIGGSQNTIVCDEWFSRMSVAVAVDGHTIHHADI